MIDAVVWLLAVEAIGIAAFPVTFLLFGRLRDRGWGFARPLSLVLVSYAVWILSYAGLLPNHRGSYIGVIVVLLLAGCGLLYRRRVEVRAWLRREWRTVLAGELVFLAVFGAWAAYRSFDPSISGTEKPMDFLFLNASATAPAAPPEDPWLAGYPVAYYYFGYWIFGGLSVLTGVATPVAFNLSLAILAAMSAGAVFSLVGGLVGASGGSRRASVVSGLAAVGLLLFVANLTGFWELGSLYHLGGRGFYDWLSIEGIEANQPGESWRPARHWWWWAASRVINTHDAQGTGQDFTIQEFPFFSFMLGDLHPHVMSIPFVLLVAGMSLSVLVSADRWGFGWLRRHLVQTLLLSLALGALGAINAWDIATFGALLFVVVILKSYRQGQSGLLFAALRALPPLLLVAGLALLFYAPFYFGTFSSQVPLTAPIGPAKFPTRPIHFLTVWGMWIVLLAPFIVAVIAGPLRRYAGWAKEAVLNKPGASAAKSGIDASVLWMLGIAFAVPFLVWAGIHLEVNPGATISDLGERFLAVLPLAIVNTALVIALVRRARSGPADGGLFVLVLLSAAAYLLFGVELLFIHDLFGNRMNTVFKVYYQAWIILAAAGGYAVYYWSAHHRFWKGWRVGLSRGAFAVVLVLVAGALYYPIAASLTKANAKSPTLDGLAYIGDSERAAIEWLRSNARRGDAMVEAVGGGYTEFGRVSSSTGIPTVLNWPGHERQWRGTGFSFQDRETDVERIYVTSDGGEARQLLAKYDVRFVYIGSRELTKYPSA
ncbi:MAG: hypothetical protein HY682_10095, partial [Chloroflexi bacterium]|nr:hypothetical protein [Chloroflexota bacterium]